MEVSAFYLLSALAIGGALLVVTLRNLFHSALALALSFFGVAGLYVLLHADFVAATQVLIYIGAVVTLAIFAIMLTARIYNPAMSQVNEQVLPTLLAALSLFILITTTLLKTPWSNIHLEAEGVPTTKEIGSLLLGQYLFPFELISILLLAALIGAIVIAREEK